MSVNRDSTIFGLASLVIRLLAAFIGKTNRTTFPAPS